MVLFCLRQCGIRIAALSGNHLTPLIHCTAVLKRGGNININLAGQAQHFLRKLNGDLNHIGWSATGKHLKRFLDLKCISYF